MKNLPYSYPYQKFLKIRANQVMQKIYILLPVHNRRVVTERFIDCLAAQTYSNYHLVLIDDGSTDNTDEMVKFRIGNLSIIKGKGDWWWAGSLQQGIDWLHQNQTHPDDVVLMINDDVVIDNNFIETGQKELLSSPDTFLQATVCCDSSREVLDVGVVYDDKKLQFKQAQSTDKINCLTTNGLFMRWRDLILVGNFYPRLLPHYLSDYEFTIRAGRKGLQLSIAKDLILWWNKETTGPRHFDQSNFSLFWKTYFSKKSPANPIYWTSFVLLVSQPHRIPLQLVRIWRNALVVIVRHALSSLKAKFSRIMRN